MNFSAYTASKPGSDEQENTEYYEIYHLESCAFSGAAFMASNIQFEKDVYTCVTTLRRLVNI